jgi:hypothetical protein
MLLFRIHCEIVVNNAGWGTETGLCKRKNDGKFLKCFVSKMQKAGYFVTIFLLDVQW